MLELYSNLSINCAFVGFCTKYYATIALTKSARRLYQH